MSFSLTKQAAAAITGSVQETISQSEIMLRASCPRKWFYRYALKLGKQGLIDLNLLYGTLMHSLLEQHYKGEEPRINWPQKKGEIISPTDYEGIELAVEKAKLAFAAYQQHYEQLDAKLRIRIVEEVIEIEYKGLKLSGKIDMVAHPTYSDAPFIWDFKTAGKFDANLLDAWTFRFQFLFYAWLYWQATGERPGGTMVNGLLKTGLRPKIADRKSKRRESQEEYLRRVAGDLTAHREKYFYRQRLPLGKGVLERFEQEMLLPNLIPFYRMGVVSGVPTSWDFESYALAQNTNQCHMYGSNCEFLHLCKEGPIALAEFETRKVKHQELVDNSEDEEEDNGSVN